MSENKTVKYFKYAIGEIVLVVIGILIALQINNWNEEKKTLKEEQKVLNALKVEIENNLVSLKTTIARNENMFKASGGFFKKHHANSDLVYDITEINDLMIFAPNKLDFSILKEILGTNSRALISNDVILIQLRKLKKAYNRTDKTEFYIDDLFNNQVIDFARRSGVGVYSAKVEVDENYKSTFKLNEEFFSLLGIVNSYQDGVIISGKALEKVMQETLDVLTKEKNND